jgi:cell wall assembly regulator SMI1
MPVTYPPFVDLVATFPALGKGKGASEAEILAAEAALETEFPIAYRLYLSQLGYLIGEPEEMYGLGEGVPSHMNLVDCAIAERTKFMPYQPSHLIPLCNDGFGNHYCIDLRSGADDPPVVFWDHEQDSNQVPEPIAEQLTIWLFRWAAELD